MRDPGLQPERTTLAWLRTSGSMLSIAVLLFRSAGIHRSVALLAAAVMLAFAALLVLVQTYKRAPMLQDPGSRANTAILATAVMVAVAGAIVGGMSALRSAG